MADSMAGPVMAMGVNAGMYLINQLNQLACIIIDDHDRIYTSKDVNIINWKFLILVYSSGYE